MIDSSNLNISPIGSNQIPGINPEIKKPDVAIFDNAPIDVSVGSFFGKIVLGIMIGLCVAFLNFACISSLGFNDSMANILLPIIGFIVTLIGNSVLALLFNIFFSKKYYNLGKMIGLIFVASIILFIFFFIIYIIFKDYPYVVFGFHMIFSLFISLNLIDFLAQPNYSASSLIANTLGGILSVVIFLAIRNVLSTNNQSPSGTSYTIIFCIASSLISYGITILGAEIRNGIYYKMYERGNNPFYLPSLNELREERQKEEVKKQKEEEDVNVDMK